jgi:hypothetical protein
MVGFLLLYMAFGYYVTLSTYILCILSLFIY